MKIVAAEAIPFRIALKKPFTIALGTLTHSNHVLVKLTDDEGRIGWGETTTFHAVYGYDQKDLYLTLTDHLLPAIIGFDPRNRTVIQQRLEMAIPYNLMAKTGVDLACLDLAGQAAGLPIHALIGGKRVEAVPLIAAVGIVGPEEAVDQAQAILDDGFKSVKIKIGLNAREDVARVLAIRKAVGDDTPLRVDANQGYDRPTAFWALPRLEEAALEWIEQPLHHSDLHGMKMLCDRLDTPIAADESMYTPEDAALVISLGAADILNIKVTKCGGIYRSQKIAALAQANGIPCYVGGCIETTPGMTAGVHFYAATPNIVSAAEIRGATAYVDDIAVTPLPRNDGAAIVPDKPGLGVEIDLDKLERYRVKF